jgi:hypothetical protein
MKPEGANRSTNQWLVFILFYTCNFALHQPNLAVKAGKAVGLIKSMRLGQGQASGRILTLPPMASLETGRMHGGPFPISSFSSHTLFGPQLVKSVKGMT